MFFLDLIMNDTGAFLLQTMLYLVNTKSPVPQMLNITLLEEPITDPFFQNDTMICYGMYGCFSVISPWTDINRPVTEFPDHPTKISPRYCLHTRYNRNYCQYLDHINRSSIYRSFFTPFHKTYVLTHGFLENGDKPWLKNMSTQLLKREDANVIIVDWGNGSAPPYSKAVANIRVVGRMTAVLIYALTVLTGANTENFHMIGHSLGAHLSGYVGYTLKHNFNCTLGRITGMDPAEPHFAKTQFIVRLDTSDAQFVDVIHTNARPFISGGLGINDPIGHLDFFPNNGDNQPGCDNGMMRFIKNENQSMIAGLRKFVACDHVRSHEFMLESIDTSQCTFLSVECDSWANFLAGRCFPCKTKENQNGSFCANSGLPAIDDWRNFDSIKRTEMKPIVLYTITNSEKPFCATLYRVIVCISNSTASIEHKGEVGVFYISINGTRGKTNMTKVFGERYFPPNSTHQYVIGGTNVGEITSATLKWVHPTTVNFLTWRIDPVIHVGSVIIETFVGGQSVRLCPLLGEVLASQSSMKMKICKR